MVYFRLIDKFHFEIESQINRQCADSNLQVYFFFPHQLGINAYTYSKNIFYQNLVSEQGYFYGNPSLDKSHEQIADLKAIPTNSKADHPAYWKQVSLLSVQWRKAIKATFSELRKSEDAALIDEKLHVLEHLFGALRELEPKEDKARFFRTFQFLDSYLSWHLQQKLLKLATELKTSENLTIDDWHGTLFNLVKKEQKYYRKKGFKKYKPNEDGASKLLWRMKQVQRYLDSPILLNTHRKPVGIITEQMVFGLAAAGSMAFATAIAFYAQEQYGNFSTVFFYVIIASYILKDRLKDLSRKLIYGFLSRKFYSFSYIVSTKDNDKRIATIKDTCEFVEKDSLPDNIRAIRDRNILTSRRADDKHVLLYKKTIKLTPSSFTSDYENMYDNIKVNLSRLIRNLSDERKDMYFYEEGKTTKIVGRQRFEINLCIRFNSGDTTVIKYYRLLINKKGVYSVEESK
jgi:hypothetical protein